VQGVWQLVSHSGFPHLKDSFSGHSEGKSCESKKLLLSCGYLILGQLRGGMQVPSLKFLKNPSLQKQLSVQV
jgi:hypothetical protein